MRFKDKMAEVYETDIPNNFFPLAIEKYSAPGFYNEDSGRMA